MTGRHTRKPVWLTRLRAPFATTSARDLPEFDLDPNPLTAEHVGAWRNRVAGGLWLAVSDGSQRIGTPRRTEAEALDHLAPRVRATQPLAARVRGLVHRVRHDWAAAFSPRFPSDLDDRDMLGPILAGVAGLVIGCGLGMSLVEAPSDCAKAFTLADKTFVDYENVTTAVVLMKSRGQSEYEGHEADAIELWDDIDAAKADYRDAKAACLGDGR
jgi:hypothetical protein